MSIARVTYATSFKRHLEATSLLLENGADPNSRNHLGRALLYMVSQGDREETHQSVAVDDFFNRNDDRLLGELTQVSSVLGSVRISPKTCTGRQTLLS